VPGGHPDHRGNDSRDDDTRDAAPSPVLDAELVRRLHALIEEVTDQLMQSPHQDRNTCRADAITLLIVTSEQIDDTTEPGESPLMYLLLEEQQKAAAALAVTELPGHASAFLRA